MEPEPQEPQIFCLSGTGTVVYSESGFGSGSNINWNTKVKKFKNKNETNFWDIMLTLKRQDFFQIFWNNCHIWSGSDSGFGSGTESGFGTGTRNFFGVGTRNHNTALPGNEIPYSPRL